MKPSEKQDPESLGIRLSGASAAPCPDPIDYAAIRDQAHRILASQPFTGSDRMSRFLRFAVEETIQGRGGELKEYLLGLAIFDRGQSFDPRVDPIVRVEARRLRSKLRSYYENEGRNDPVLIELPKGSYVPRFRLRSTPAVDEQAPRPEEQGSKTYGSIAVLPFANLSPDPDNEYFSDGLTEELIHALTKLEGLSVVAWNTAVKLKDRLEDIASIGRQLKVATVLAGSVRRAGGRLRVMARLIDTSTGYYLWSETYDREFADLFAIQEQISRAIVDTLRIRLIGGNAARVIARAPSDLEAYNLYLKGRFHWNKRTRAGLESAVGCFREAIAVNSSFAPAYAGLADAYTLLGDHGLAPPSEVIPEAKAAALRALELDANLAEAYASLALIRSLYDWQWAEAGEHYRRALELNPGYVVARHWHACDYLALLGRMDEAIAELKIAMQLDPLSAVVHESLAYVLMLARRYEESLEQSRRVAELDPYFYKVHTGPGRAYIQMGRYAEAIEMLEKGRKLCGDASVVLGALGQAHALNGNRAEARAILEKLDGLSRTTHVPATAFAFVHMGLGEKDRALDWLREGCARHELTLATIGVHPGYDPLRNEPGYRELLERIGLAG